MLNKSQYKALHMTHYKFQQIFSSHVGPGVGGGVGRKEGPTEVKRSIKILVPTYSKIIL